MQMKVVAWPGLKEKNVNPYTWLVYQPMESNGAKIIDFSFYKALPSAIDIFHVHWPEGIFWNRFSRSYPWLAKVYAERLLSAISGVRRAGGAIVWTSHNLQPHEPLNSTHERIWAYFFPQFRSMVDLVINLTAESEALVRASYPDLEASRFAIISHPHYRTAYPKAVAIQDARAAMGVPGDDFILCCVGGIRPSKGILELAEVFSVAKSGNERLMISGECTDEGYGTQLRAIAERSGGSIYLRFGRLSDQEMAVTMSGADVTVINFRNILNSGSVMLSLSYDTPACVPAQGSLRDLFRRIGGDWLIDLPQPLSAMGLRLIIDRVKSAGFKRKQQLLPLPADFDPETVSLRTFEEYQLALEARKVRLAPCQ